MKYTALIVFFALLAGSTSFAQQHDSAQIDKSVNAGKPQPPRYYYYPNLQSYFDTKEGVYHLRQNGGWQVAKEIPNGFGGYSLTKTIKVPINDYFGDDVTQFLDIHKKEYPYVSPAKARMMSRQK